MDLYEASNQWANRPEDERFSSLQEMRDACFRYADSAHTYKVFGADLRAEANGDDVVLAGKNNTARLTHYAFGQLSRIAGAPPSFLRTLPARLTADVLNVGLEKLGKEYKILAHRNGGVTARAITSESYDRVWNYEVLDAVLRNFNDDWRVPPARPAFHGQKGTRIATESDILPNSGDFGLSIKVGDEIAPAGLYASDHDMFAFLVNQSDPVWDGGKFNHKGVFIQNSEVGDCALKIKLMLYDNVCGNHIVWGVSKVAEISVRHVKSVDVDRGDTLRRVLAKWNVAVQTLPTGKEMADTIAAAREKTIAASKDDVLDAVFAFGRTKGLLSLSRGAISNAYELAERTPRYGAPNSVWGMVNGLTEYSQTLASGYADARNELDTAAGRLLDMVK